MLLKGLGEARTAPSAISAAEMILVRLAYAAELPPPGDLVKRIEDAGGVQAAVQQGAGSTPTGSGGGGAAPQAYTTTNAVAGGAGAQAAPDLAGQPDTARLRLPDFEAVVALVREKKEALLDQQLRDHVHLVHFEQGRIELRLDELASTNLPSELGAILGGLTGERWVVSISSEAGAETLSRQAANVRADRKRAAEEDPLVKAVLEKFPGAVVTDVKDMDMTADLPPVDPDQVDFESVDFDDGDFDA